jgi:hypothetical protein
MALDRAVLGKMASEQMQALEDSYDENSDVQIGGVMTLVEVLTPIGQDEQGNMQFASNIRLRHNIGDPYRIIGLLQQAAHDILAPGNA